MVGIGGVVAALNLAEAGSHLGGIQAKLLDQACALQQVEAQHG